MRKFNLRTSFVVAYVILIVFTSGEVIFHSERRLQMSILQSLSYSSYTSIQIFQLLNWRQNDQTIKQINSQSSNTFKASHNQFSYLSQQEIQALFLNINVNQFNTVNVEPVSAIPSFRVPPIQQVFINNGQIQNNIIDIDWRRNNAVTSIKNQGSCGACWAFVAAADIQSLLFKKNGLKTDLSEQQLIDCSYAFGNIGCVGGMMDNAFRYVVIQGIALESSYPYQQKESLCRYNKNEMSSFSISSSKIIYGDCKALVQVLKTRPVSVVVSANLGFIFYRNGILNNCGNVINHAIQLVGYYKSVGESYYIGKNSWGITWGQQGFILIDSAVEEGNLCNVCAYPQYSLA